MDAWRKGAEVEYFAFNWEKIEDPGWFLDTEYRIATTPEYIPFDFTDAEFLIGKVVKSKVSGWIFMITKCNREYCISGETYYKYGEVLNNFTFLDGSPCGKLKQ